MPQNTALNLIHKQISNYHTLNRHSKVPLEHCRSLWHFYACSANLKAQIHCASLLPLPPFQQLTSKRQKGILFSSILFIIISQPSFIKSSTKSPPPPSSQESVPPSCFQHRLPPLDWHMGYISNILGNIQDCLPMVINLHAAIHRVKFAANSPFLRQ